MIAPDRAPAEAGLTMVEMLIVLAVFAVVAGSVALSIGSGTNRNAEVEARRLAARLELAGDEAMVTGRTIALAWDHDSYRFVTWRSDKWQDDTVTALEPHTLPSGLQLETDEKSPVIVGADGGGTPMALKLVGKNQGWSVAFDGAAAQARAGG
jgi:general secretion pathway protein H